MTVRAYIENDIKKEKLKLTWLDVKKAWQKENPNEKMGSAKQNLALYKAWKEKKWRPKGEAKPVVVSTVSDDKIEQKEILEKSGVLECLKKLKKFKVNETIQKSPRGSWFYELTNPNYPKYKYAFFSNGKMAKINLSEDKVMMVKDMDEEGWNCPQWKKYRIDNKLIPGEQQPSELPKDEKNVVDEPSKEKIDEPKKPELQPLQTDVKKLLTRDEINALSKVEKEILKKQIIPERLCKKQIKRFHTAYKKRLKLDLEPGEYNHNQTRDIVKRCRTQHKYNDTIQGYLNDLISINYNWEKTDDWDPTIFRIMDSTNNLKNVIKDSLNKKYVQINEQKKNNLLKEEIVKTRLMMFERALSNFKKIDQKQKIKSGFKFLREIHRLKKLNLINEELHNVLQDLFGNSLDNIISNVAEPLFKSILKKIEISEEIKNETISKILMDEESMISHMENCDLLSEFISTKIIEVVNNKVGNQQILGDKLIDSSIIELMNDDVFMEIVDEKINQEVCRIFELYVENAKNLVTKIQQDLTLPE